MAKAKVKVELKKDSNKALGEGDDANYRKYTKCLENYISKLKKQSSPQHISHLRLLLELYDYISFSKVRGDKMWDFIDRVNDTFISHPDKLPQEVYDLLTEGIDFLTDG